MEIHELEEQLTRLYLARIDRVASLLPDGSIFQANLRAERLEIAARNVRGERLIARRPASSIFVILQSDWLRVAELLSLAPHLRELLDDNGFDEVRNRLRHLMWEQAYVSRPPRAPSA